MALITAARIKNIKRVHDITITPEADAHLVLIAGPNMAGKTSVMDAIAMVIGGAKLVPDDPVRHGAEEGSAQIELDNGLIVTRTVEPDGSSKLEVKDRTGKVGTPQKLLDKLLGQRLLDPWEFVRLPGPERRLKLLEIIDTKKEIPAMDAHRKKVYDAREEVGRKVRDAKGERERLGEKVEVPPTIDVAALSAELAELSKRQEAGQRLELESKDSDTAHDIVRATLDRTEAQIAKLRADLAAAEKSREEQLLELARRKEECQRTADAAKTAAAAWHELAPRRAQIDAELARANENNRAATAAELMNKRRDEAQATVDARQKQWSEQAAVLEKIDAKKLAFLAAAKLPVPGLGIADGDITFNDVPLAQASGAEKLRVALGIAVASQSEIRDILIRDAALLDENSMAMVEELAVASGVRVWLERVGTRDPGAIIIRDGFISEEA